MKERVECSEKSISAALGVLSCETTLREVSELITECWRRDQKERGDEARSFDGTHILASAFMNLSRDGVIVERDYTNRYSLAV